MWKTSEIRYGRTARGLHWASALFILFAFASGKLTDNLGVEGINTLRVHVSVGTLIALLTASRLLLWIAFDKRPPPVEGTPAVQKAAARIVHIALYAVLVVLIGSGIGMMILSGAPEILFSGNGGMLPDFHRYPPRQAHEFAGMALIVLLAIHVGAALYHHFALRDETLRRMI